MSVAVENRIVRLVAPSRVEDAEPLWSALNAAREACQPVTVDLSAAGLPHAAVLQLLLVYRPVIAADFDDPFARAWLSPLLGSSGSAALLADAD